MIVKNIGVIGAGIMGNGIAQVAAQGRLLGSDAGCVETGLFKRIAGYPGQLRPGGKKRKNDQRTSCRDSRTYQGHV